jgi:hypothetical protein
MGTTTISAERFKAEVQRRLIDRHELMLMLDVRSRRTIRERVRKGTLPPPIIERDSHFTFWDRDAVQPDRKETK